MAFRTAPHRRRAHSLAGALLLAGVVAVLPAGPGPETAAAQGPRARQATHLGAFTPAGRVVMRELAMGGRVTRSTTPTTKAPTRLGWTRAGRTSTGWLDGTEAPILATAAVAPVTGTLAPATGTPMPPTGTSRPATGTPATAAGGAALAATAAAGPGVVGTAWDGLTDQAVPCGSSRPCVEPADPWVAVSSTHVVQMTNDSTRITDRSGGDPRQLTNREFFNVPAWSPTAFAADPRVLFDPAHGRWVATLFAGTCSGGALFLAVSETADPTGAWLRYYRESAGVWPDFPTLGYSAALVAIGANEFGVSCGTGGSYVMGAYVGARLHVVDWADLTNGGDAPAMQSTLPDPAAFSYAPAAGLSGGDALHAVVALDDGSTDRADLAYVGVSGTVGGGTIVFGVPLSLAALPLDKLQDPPVPVDAGGLIGVQRNALDLRPTDAVWRDGRLAIASSSACLRGTVYRPCARVTELLTRADLALPALRQDLRLLPASGSTDTFMPGVGYSDDGTLWTVFSQAGAGRYVSSWARRQLATDPPGAWSPGAALVAAGRGPYGGTAGAGLNERWGDYVGVARDPAEPASVWQANQLADTGGGWTTRVARLGDDPTPPTLGAPRPFFVAGTRAGVSGVALKIAWSQADAGSGVASVRLQRSANGGTFVNVALASSTARDVTNTLAYGTRYTYRLAATDNAGNVTAWVEGPSFTPSLYTEGSSRVRYSGSWTLSRSSSFLGGKVRWTGVSGRRATMTLSGLAVAWVSTVARSRGSARVYADGVRQGTYSTYRSTTVYRRIITGRTFAAAGTHTYRVEVVGTSGRPRVDVDAFIVLR